MSIGRVLIILNVLRCFVVSHVCVTLSIRWNVRPSKHDEAVPTGRSWGSGWNGHAAGIWIKINKLLYYYYYEQAKFQYKQLSKLKTLRYFYEWFIFIGKSFAVSPLISPFPGVSDLRSSPLAEKAWVRLFSSVNKLLLSRQGCCWLDRI